MKYPRGQTAKTPHAPAARPPKKAGRVANDFYANPLRSAIMPPPTGETQEPRGKALSKSGRKPVTATAKTPMASLKKALEKYER